MRPSATGSPRSPPASPRRGGPGPSPPRRGARAVLVSAAAGEGVDELLKAIERRIARGRPTFAVTVDPADGRGLSWLHREAEVLDRRTDDAGRIIVVARIAPEKEPRLLNRFSGARRTS